MCSIEATALEELKRKLLDVFAVGPMLPPHHLQQQQADADADEILAEDRIHLYKQDDQKETLHGVARDETSQVSGVHVLWEHAVVRQAPGPRDTARPARLLPAAILVGGAQGRA